MIKVILPPNAVRFSPGELVFTPGAVEALDSSGDSCLVFLARHISGDWGIVSAGDAALNETSVKSGDKILSAYKLRNALEIWIITDADRSTTTFLLPYEY